MYASTLPELAGQKFNDIAEATLAIDEKFFWCDWLGYAALDVKKRAHICLEWIVAC